jgi:putative DNA primase/helicase
MQTTASWPELVKLEGTAETIAAPQAEESKYHPHTDLGNAELLVELYGKDIRYCIEWNCWLVWNETCWVRDQKGVQAGRLANLAARHRYRQAADIESAENRRATLLWARKSKSASARHNCLSQAMTLPGITIQVSALDCSPWLLNAPNGTLNLETGELREHHREDFLTKVATTSYIASARAPLWVKMLSEIYGQNTELIDFMQRALGYSLTGDTRERTFFLNHGEGLNGKSTVLETILAILGDDYAVVVNPDILMSSKRDGDSPSPQMADLRGARFVLTSESRRGAQLDESVVKRLTGGSDTIVARRLNENPVRFRPTHKIWLATNHRPSIQESTQAIWDRICLIPYQLRIENPDLKLPEKLKAEAEGILAWLVEGCIAWNRDGLKPPAVVRQANLEYRQESDELAGFLDTFTYRSKGHTVAVEAFYQAYLSWATQFGEKAYSGRELSKMLKERGFEQKRTKRCFVWCGLGLKDNSVPEISEGDQSKITRSPIDHPLDHPANPYGISILSPGDQGDPDFRVRSPHEEKTHVRRANLDHLDHLSTKNIDEIRVSGVIYGGDQTKFLDHQGSPLITATRSKAVGRGTDK